MVELGSRPLYMPATITSSYAQAHTCLASCSLWTSVSPMRLWRKFKFRVGNHVCHSYTLLWHAIMGLRSRVGHLFCVSKVNILENQKIAWIIQPCAVLVGWILFRNTDLESCFQIWSPRAMRSGVQIRWNAAWTLSRVKREPVMAPKTAPNPQFNQTESSWPMSCFFRFLGIVLNSWSIESNIGENMYRYRNQTRTSYLAIFYFKFLDPIFA